MVNKCIHRLSSETGKVILYFEYPQVEDAEFITEFYLKVINDIGESSNINEGRSVCVEFRTAFASDKLYDFVFDFYKYDGNEIIGYSRVSHLWSIKEMRILPLGRFVSDVGEIIGYKNKKTEVPYIFTGDCLTVYETDTFVNVPANIRKRDCFKLLRETKYNPSEISLRKEYI